MKTVFIYAKGICFTLFSYVLIKHVFICAYVQVHCVLPNTVDYERALFLLFAPMH